MKWNRENIVKSLLLFGKTALIVLPFVALYYVYFLIWHGGEIYCFVELVFGIPCMGCGMTRAMLNVLQFDFITAFHYHPLIFIMPIILLIYVFRDMKYVQNLYHSKWFWISIFILFIVVYIIRMVLYYPDVEPMTIYEDAYLRRLIRLLD
jgi:hypothetical protein